MYLKIILALASIYGGIISLSAQSTASLPDEPGSIPALETPYFPGRQYTFVWRNWTLVPTQRLAEVLGTSTDNVCALARSMGLPPQGKIEPQWSTSAGYITVLRRNWHLLPYDQLLTLLDISREEMAWRLSEDDYLYVKLGYRKPLCATLRYEVPTPAMQEMASRIAGEISQLGDQAFAEQTPRFAFIDDFFQTHKPLKTAPKSDTTDSEFALRLIYPYCATFGDPLMDPELTSYPEGLLQRLSEVGVNGIWMHSVLWTLVPPDGIFPGDEEAFKRIEGLNRLVQRAAKYGIGIYLYVNEPRAMNRSFFQDHPQRQALIGVNEGEMHSLCTSVPGVLEWTSRSLEQVFKNVPDLAGVFTITASENLTNCASRGQQQSCDRCKSRPYADLITEVNQAIAQGVTRGNPNAKVLVWDWGWNDAYEREIISNLPKCSWLMSVSEWELPIERGGVTSVVGEYALSAVGPGPRALRHWQYAKEAGLKTVAKVQVNASWEMAVVPDVPVLDLVAQHAENLSKASTDGVMLSWSLGGYPSLNLELFQSYKPGDTAENLRQLAEKHYGKQAGPTVCKAWSIFSAAFSEFPYQGQVLYSGPQHMGPANPLYVEPTGYPASMVGIPYDALDLWRGVFPSDVFASQMQKIADGFEKGCALLREAITQSKGTKRKTLETALGRAEAVAIHAASSANQTSFTDARNRFLASKEPAEKERCIAQMRRAAEAEAVCTKRLLPLLCQDPTIGYESSNHYFYVPQDLLEKELNVQYVLSWLDQQTTQQSN